jgi:hypothetical protein
VVPGTVSDLAGFYKETAYWIRSWWLSNITNSDAGKPPLNWPGRPELAGEPNGRLHDAPCPPLTSHGASMRQPSGAGTTVFILEGWLPAPAASGLGGKRTINVYTNAKAVKLELNGKPLAAAQDVEYFGQATFTVTYSAGNLTAIGLDHSGKAIGSHSVVTPAAVASLSLSLDAPSARTGTGTHVVADGEDVAMVRAEVLDANGNFA